MSFVEQRSNFTVFIYLGDTEQSSAVKMHLSTHGYDCFMFADQDTLVDRLKQTAPHVLVFAAEGLLTPLSEFVGQVLEFNSEIQFIFVGPVGQTPAIVEYREYNFAEFIPEGDHVESRVLWAVDRTCECLYLTYANENLLQKMEDSEKKAAAASHQLVEMQNQLKIKTAGGNSALLMQAYRGAQSKDDAIQVFFKQINVNAIFFRFLPTVQTFVATSAKGLEIDLVKGVGARLTQEEFKALNDNLDNGKLPPPLAELMSSAVRVREYFVQKVQPHRNLEGIFVFWGPQMKSMAVIENEFSLFHLIYSNIHFVRRAELLDINDPVTELFNRNYFIKKLEEEVSRARRLKQSVSLILMSIDHFVELEQSLGKSNRDLILKSVASIVSKTSRVNDLSCRADDNVLAMILPHAQKKGSTLRAERLRRIIEAHSFTVNGLKISVSAGVSEYPGLCGSSEELEMSAKQALDFIVSRGGNKVCLYQPPAGFRPEYEVKPV